MALISFKVDTEKYIDSIDECQRLLEKIPDKRWKDEAEEIYNATKRRLENMTSGNREISVSDVNNQEMALMRSAKSCIHCIYCADSELKLQLRVSTKVTNPLCTIMNGYRDMNHNDIEKQRIIVLSNIDFSLKRNQQLLRKVNDFNTKPCSEGGLGFETRYVLMSKLMEQQIFLVSNLLLVDNREATTVQDKTIYPADYWEKDTQIIRNLICFGIIDPVKISELKKIFEKSWDTAMGIENFLTQYESEEI